MNASCTRSRTGGGVSPRRVWVRALAVGLSLLLVACDRAPHAAAPTAGLAPAPSASEDGSNAAASGEMDKVSVDVVVRSKRHKPVTDLTASQLAMKDDGVPVKLSSFDRVDLTSGQQHLAAFVFDQMNSGQARAERKMAEKILSVIPDRGYSLAVLQVNGRLHLLQGYTSDFHATDTALIAATPDKPAPPSTALTPAETELISSVNGDSLRVSSADRAKAKTLLNALEQSQRILEDRHSYASLAGLQALVQSEKLVEGRKFIFYFCSGINSNSDAGELLQSIVGIANRMGVTIYVIDANPQIAPMRAAMQASQVSTLLGTGNGTGNTNQFGKTDGSPPDILTYMQVHQIQEYEFGSLDLDQSPLAALSAGTGGTYLNSLDDNRRALRQLHEDLTSWYEATWVPPDTRFDGKFRPIDLRSARKDVTLRARSGYFAVPPGHSLEIPPFEVPLLEVLKGATLPSELPVRAGVLRLGVLPDGNSAELIVQVPVAQLAVHEDYNTHISTAQAALLAVIKDSKGDILERFGEEIPLHQAAELYHADGDQMLTLTRTFSADPGVYTLEVVANDALGHKTGAQRSTFTIEAPKHGVAISDVALVQSIEPVEEDPETFEPMRYEDGRVVPNVGDMLPEKTDSAKFFFLLHPVAGSESQPALRMQILCDGKLLMEAPLPLQKVSGTGAGVPYLATLRGGDLPPGNYQVKALLTQNGETASSSAYFHVAGDAGVASAFSAAGGVQIASMDPGVSGLLSERSSLGSGFSISSATSGLAALSESNARQMIEDARQRALSWSDTLENFICFEVTNHFVKSGSDAAWKQEGTLVERLQLVDKAQTRSTVMLNGEASTTAPDQLEFFRSSGEFGAMFHMIFDPSAKTEFTWKQAALLDGQPIQIFAFKVARTNSTFNLTDRDEHTAVVGFSGLLYLDPATGSIRRVSIAADDIPSRLEIRACSLSVDYSWMAMQNHDFLLPVRGVVGMQETSRHPVMNEFAFRDYRRFGSQVRIFASDGGTGTSKD